MKMFIVDNRENAVHSIICVVKNNIDMVLITFLLVSSLTLV